MKLMLIKEKVKEEFIIMSEPNYMTIHSNDYKYIFIVLSKITVAQS